MIPRDANNIISQLVYSASLFDRLDRDSIFNLSLTSSTISKVIRPFINNTFFFRLDDDREFQIYNPEKIKLNSIIKSYPSYITQILFDNEFNESLNVNDLPTTLTHLKFCLSFNQIVDNKLPRNLKKLSFGGYFNFPIDHLPANLEKLTFLEEFNQPIDHLPPNLKILRLGEKFNHPVNNLPHSLTNLSFGGYFNFPIDHLPPNLKILRLGEEFNHPVNNLPHSLTSLHFGIFFNQPIDHLPSNITKLMLSENLNYPVDNLPTKITKLRLGKDFNKPLQNLPPNLTKLDCGPRFNQPIHSNNLPPYLTHLSLGWGFQQHIDTLSPNLTHLKFSFPFKQKIPLENLPTTLVFLKLGQDNFDADDDVFKILPNLEYLQFFPSHNNNLKFLLPPKNFHFVLNWLNVDIEFFLCITFKKGNDENCNEEYDEKDGQYYSSGFID